MARVYIGVLWDAGPQARGLQVRSDLAKLPRLFETPSRLLPMVGCKDLHVAMGGCTSG